MLLSDQLRTEYSSTVWLRYLKFKSGHFASFSASSQRRLYSRSIRALESKGKQASIAHEKKERAEGVFIMVSVAETGGVWVEYVLRNTLDFQGF